MQTPTEYTPPSSPHLKRLLYPLAILLLALAIIAAGYFIRDNAAEINTLEYHIHLLEVERETLSAAYNDLYLAYDDLHDYVQAMDYEYAVIIEDAARRLQRLEDNQ